MPRIEIAPAPRQRLRLVGASLVFLTPGSAILVWASPTDWLLTVCAWAMLAMGLLGLLSALLTHAHQPTLIISEKGIEYTPSPFGLVPWEEVEHIGLRRVGIVVAVADNKKYFSRLSLAQRCRWWSGMTMLPGDLLVITPQSVNMALADVFKTIDGQMSAFERSQQQGEHH